MINNKISFCNGKSECGCKMEFTSGYGEYSDSHYITLCDKHYKPFDPIYPENIQRGNDGYWTHSRVLQDFPKHEFSLKFFEDWIKKHNLKYCIHYMEETKQSCLEEYKTFGSCKSWTPTTPLSEGYWFILSIHETENDGVVCIWVKYNN